MNKGHCRVCQITVLLEDAEEEAAFLETHAPIGRIIPGYNHLIEGASD
jgi:hypothetical protein